MTATAAAPGIPPNIEADLASALGDVRKAAAEFRTGRPVAPLGPLAPSPVLAGGAPATTVPFPLAPGPAAAAPPPPPAPTFLKPLWTWGPQEGVPPTERLSTDGIARIAYETSAEPDACGGPVWKRAPLPFSPGAEAVLAQHVGAVAAVAELATALRTIAGNVPTEYAAALATNILTKYGMVNGPRLKAPAARVPAAPMPMDGSPVEGTVVVVQHTDCVLMVITSDHLPKFGDTLHQEHENAPAFHGEVIRANAKDAGAFDLIVRVLDGAPAAGPLTVRRPLPPAPPSPAPAPAVAAASPPLDPK